MAQSGDDPDGLTVLAIQPYGAGKYGKGHTCAGLPLRCQIQGGSLRATADDIGHRRMRTLRKQVTNLRKFNVRLLAGGQLLSWVKGRLDHDDDAATDAPQQAESRRTLDERRPDKGEAGNANSADSAAKVGIVGGCRDDHLLTYFVRLRRPTSTCRSAPSTSSGSGAGKKSQHFAHVLWGFLAHPWPRSGICATHRRSLHRRRCRTGGKYSASV